MQAHSFVSAFVICAFGVLSMKLFRWTLQGFSSFDFFLLVSHFRLHSGILTIWNLFLSVDEDEEAKAEQQQQQQIWRKTLPRLLLYFSSGLII